MWSHFVSFQVTSYFNSTIGGSHVTTCHSMTHVWYHVVTTYFKKIDRVNVSSMVNGDYMIEMPQCCSGLLITVSLILRSSLQYKAGIVQWSWFLDMYKRILHNQYSIQLIYLQLINYFTIYKCQKTQFLWVAQFPFAIQCSCTQTVNVF